ncbi:MAG: SufD family Fe-S cluster assembly protein [Erysipelotrichaceae bacterium]|nr:SufD family Fe-S cluster assembly protein [Erysipelotrichaceae bacterium]
MKINNGDTLSFSDGFSVYEIDEQGDMSFSIDSENTCNVFIRIIDASDIDIKGKFKNGDSTILFWNDSVSDVKVTEEYEVSEGCSLNLSYGECNSASMERKLSVDLSGNGSSSNVSTATLTGRNKKYDIEIKNEGIDTHGDMKNYAVVLEKGRLMVNAVGRIAKGAKKSTSHQVSRALSFDKGQSTTILPQLLIDENDVQASHAMSIGKVNEKQLYYLMSRGLDIKECTMLMSLGYLLPIVDQIADEELKDTMKNELERKIMEVCSM